MARYEFRAVRPCSTASSFVVGSRKRRQELPALGQGSRRLADDGRHRGDRVSATCRSRTSRHTIRAPFRHQRPRHGRTIIDSASSACLQHRRMRDVWSDENRPPLRAIERALATSRTLGIIPGGGRRDRAQRESQHRLDRLRAQTERIGYPVLGVVRSSMRCAATSSASMPLGATTQDITDTATVMQIREGLAIVEADLVAIPAALAGWRAGIATPVVAAATCSSVPVTSATRWRRSSPRWSATRAARTVEAARVVGESAAPAARWRRSKRARCRCRRA